jgi:mRNA interferase MazF
VVVQGDPLNRSRISTVICIPLTSNLRWTGAPGNVMLPTRLTGLPQDSVGTAAHGAERLSVLNVLVAR